MKIEEIEQSLKLLKMNDCEEREKEREALHFDSLTSTPMLLLINDFG